MWSKLMLLPINGDHGVGSDIAKYRWLGALNKKFHRPHFRFYFKDVILTNRPVSVMKILYECVLLVFLWSCCWCVATDLPDHHTIKLNSLAENFDCNCISDHSCQIFSAYMVHANFHGRSNILFWNDNGDGLLPRWRAININNIPEREGIFFDGFLGKKDTRVITKWAWVFNLRIMVLNTIKVSGYVTE